MSMDKHISSVVKTCFLQLLEFHHIRSFIPKFAIITFANALYIPASIIVIAFYMVFQSILFIACKKYKTLLLVLLHVPLIRHILLLFSSLYIGYLLNTVNFKLCCITLRALSLGEPYYLNSLFIPRLNPHSLRSFSFNPLMLPFFNKMSNVFRSFAYAAPLL